jgi:hypothetical protein
VIGLYPISYKAERAIQFKVTEVGVIGMTVNPEGATGIT